MSRGFPARTSKACAPPACPRSGESARAPRSRGRSGWSAPSRRRTRRPRASSTATSTARARRAARRASAARSRAGRGRRAASCCSACGARTRVGEEGTPASVVPAGDGHALRGVKTFCSGAGGVQRALVLARGEDGGRRVAYLDARLAHDRHRPRLVPRLGSARLREPSRRVPRHPVLALLGAPDELHARAVLLARCRCAPRRRGQESPICILQSSAATLKLVAPDDAAAALARAHAPRA